MNLADRLEILIKDYKRQNNYNTSGGQMNPQISLSTVIRDLQLISDISIEDIIEDNRIKIEITRGISCRVIPIENIRRIVRDEYDLYILYYSNDEKTKTFDVSINFTEYQNVVNLRPDLTV